MNVFEHKITVKLQYNVCLRYVYSNQVVGGHC